MSVFGNFPSVGKPAGLVIVESPEAAQEVWERYPASSTRYYLVPPGTDLPQGTLQGFQPAAAWMTLTTLAIGLTIGAIGFSQRHKALGQVALGTGSAMIGTSLALVLRDLVEKK